MNLNSDIAIQSEALTKRFGDFTAVDAINLSTSPGQVLAILGPNGAGKTTTVRMITTLSAPTSGAAAVFGHDVVKEADTVRQITSLTGQFAALEDNMTARENLMLMAQLRGYHRGAANRIVDALIDRFDVGEFRDKLVKDVSGGQRRRIDLAASMVVEPSLLVLDEPTTGLDPRSRQNVWTTVRELVDRGVTVLLTTQYLEEADALADSIVMIDHGKTVATGTPRDLKAQLGGQRVDIVTVDQAGLSQLSQALGSRWEVATASERRTISIPANDELADLQAVTSAVAESGVAIDEIALRRPTLDDAFLALTGHVADGDDMEDAA